MDWKIGILAIVISLGLWVGINVKTAQPASIVDPQYGIIKENGEIQTIPLMCDEMAEMRDLTILEGRLRKTDAETCGTDRMGKCLPYYVQWRVLGDLYSFLTTAIQDNCKVN